MPDTEGERERGDGGRGGSLSVATAMTHGVLHTRLSDLGKTSSSSAKTVSSLESPVSEGETTPHDRLRALPAGDRLRPVVWMTCRGKQGTRQTQTCNSAVTMPFPVL